jgi:hypothetical protein
MEFSFDNAAVSTGGSNYLEPGVHLVTITDIKKGQSSQSHADFIEVIVADKDGGKASQQYYLGTEVKEGKQQSAWSITSSAILTLTCAAFGVDEATAKSKLAGMSLATIDLKLSSLLVGKQIALKLNGKWINPSDTSKKPWIKAEFAGFLFAVPVKDIAKLSTKVYIKGEPAAELATAVAADDSNPF